MEPIRIATLHTLQSGVRDIESIKFNAKLVKQGFKFTKEKIALVKMSNGKLFVHNGHHRALAIHIGGRQVLDDEEYTISDGEYSNYATVNWEDGYVTPFDVNTEVRVPDFREFKKHVLDLKQSGRIEEALSYIKESRHVYARQRTHWTIAEMARDLKKST